MRLVQQSISYSFVKSPGVSLRRGLFRPAEAAANFIEAVSGTTNADETDGVFAAMFSCPFLFSVIRIGAHDEVK